MPAYSSLQCAIGTRKMTAADKEGPPRGSQIAEDQEVRGEMQIKFPGAGQRGYLIPNPDKKIIIQIGSLVNTKVFFFRINL